MTLVQKVSKAGDLVIDFRNGTYSSSSACIFFDPYRKFMECSEDRKGLSAAEADLARTFVSWVLSLKSDIRQSGEIQAAAKVFIDEIGALLTRKKPLCGK